MLDPRMHAVRRDLADVRLAQRVFAPHYAAPMAMTIVVDAALVVDGTTVATLSVGDRFEMLDVVGTTAWGVAPDHAIVGYVDRAALMSAMDATA